MKLSQSSSKIKLQSRERMVSLQKLCWLQRSVAKVVLMEVKLVKAAQVQRGISVTVRTIGKIRICRRIFIPSGEGISPRTAWESNLAIHQKLPTLHQKHDWDYFNYHHIHRELLDSGQLKFLMPWSVHRLHMHYSHLQPLINVYHLHRISSQYEESEGIQLGHIVGIPLWNVRLICQLPEGKTETIILQQVVHLPGSFNPISQSQILDTDLKLKFVNHYGLNLYNHHG